MADVIKFYSHKLYRTYKLCATDKDWFKYIMLYYERFVEYLIVIRILMKADKSIQLGHHGSTCLSICNEIDQLSRFINIIILLFLLIKMVLGKYFKYEMRDFIKNMLSNLKVISMH